METGVAFGRELRLSEEDRTRLVGEAAELGYTSAWTNSGPDLAGIETCRRWFDASGLTTGTAVVPTPGMDLAPLTRAARALGEAGNGRFILALAQNLDIILVRIVTARPGLEAARAIIRACAPGRSA